jgi:hypothetical protein
MSKMLTGSIDLNKIDKTKIVSTDKNGNPFENGAKYLNVVVWINDEADKYGNNASIQISQSKEERDAGAKAIYIGNLKEPQSRNNEQTRANRESFADDNQLPF